MFQERDGEKEILLGNKQLLGIFFVLAILFGVFFTAGYMVGHTTGEKKPADAAAAVKSTAADAAAANGGETHAVAPDPITGNSESGASDRAGKSASVSPEPTTPNADVPAVSNTTPSRTSPAKPAKAELTRSEEEQEPDASVPALPAGRNTYLQVAALSRNDAEAVAKVLSKKGFHAHIAPKPGTQYFRVLVGPVHDASDLNSTRDALKSRMGFREVFVQHL